MPEIKDSDISDEDIVDSDDEIIHSTIHEKVNSRTSQIFQLNDGPQPKYQKNRNLKSFEKKFLGSSSEVSFIKKDAAVTNSLSNFSILEIVGSQKTPTPGSLKSSMVIKDIDAENLKVNYPYVQECDTQKTS